MAFDLSSAKEIGFDLSTASEKAGSTEDQEYLDYVTKQKSLSSRAQIPRFAGDTGEEFPILSREDWKKKKDEDFTKAGIEGLKGIGETALSLGTGAVAPILAPAHMGLDRLLGGKKDYADVLDTLTYTPRGEVGSKYVGSIGAALQALPPVGAYVNAPGMIRQGRKVPKPVVEPKAIPPVQEKIGKSIDDIPQEVKDQQSFYNKQGEFFDLESAKPVDEPMTFEKQPGPLTVDKVPEDIRNRQSLFNQEENVASRGDLSRQEGLPFTDSVEAVREAQVRGQSQRDMFVEEGQLQRSFDPYQENLRKQADQERMDLERVAEEARKQQEIDDAFIQRQKDLFDEEQWRKHSDVADALSRVEEKLMAQERPSTFRRNELGAIDVSAIHDAVEAFETGNKTAYDLLGAWRGAFDDDIWSKVYTSLNDPNSTSTVVFMSPEKFHALASERSKYEIDKFAKDLQGSIKEGLAKEAGLREIPHLTVKSDGQVISHEGRHRMDVFKENGIDLVPVILRADDFTWGDLKKSPLSLIPQDAKDFSWEGKRALSRSRGSILSRGSSDPKLMLGPREGGRNNQRGAIDVEVLGKVYNKLFHGGRAFQKWNPKTIGSGEGSGVLGPGLYASDKKITAALYKQYGGVDGVVHELLVDVTNMLDPRKKLTPEQELIYKKATEALDNLGLRASEKGVKASLQQIYDPILKEKARKAIVEAGLDGLYEHLNDVYGTEFSIFNPNAILKKNQLGAIDLSAVSDSIKALTNLGADSPEIQAAKAALIADKKRDVLYNSIPGLDAFRPIWTPEKVIAAAAQPENFRDLTSVEKQLAKTVKPGIRTVRVSSNNPLINLMGEIYSKMFSAAEEMARTYITNNDGIGPVWQKLSNDEKMQIHKLLKQGDNEQRRFTTAELDEAGYTKEQQLFMAKFYDMDAAELTLWNEKRLAIGMDPVKERPGHFRSVFKGDYWALAMENDDKGVPRVVGFVGNNTKWGFNKVKEQMQKENPGITFTEMKRRGLGGSYRRTDLAQGMADIMDFMAKNDPRIAEIRDAIKQVTDQHADGWLGAAEHALKKKGIWGNEGNKPWSKDAYKAADEAMKAYFTSWEEAVLSHHHLEANATFTALDKNEAVRAAWPKALDYVNKYSKSMTGNYTSTLGVGLNNLLDWGTQALTFNNLGPTVTREGVNQFTKRMGQLTQGFLNPAYTAMQLIQPLSTAAPEMMRVGGMADASKSSLKGIEAGFKYVRRALDPDFVVDADTAAMFAYAEDRGLLTFSEFDDVSKVTQGKVARTVDQAIDFNRVAGEISTRPTVFFTFVDMLKDMGLAKEEIFDTAYNLTQYSMTDYSPAERALMYRDLGVLGQLAGSLSQFKHSYVNQVSQWVGDSFKNPKTALVGLTMMATLAGYRGLPGYDDLDAIVKYLTNKFGDKQMSINDIIASNAPEWFNSETPWAFDQDNTTFGDYLGFGGLSGAAGVNLSSRLGSAQLLPESPAEAVSPYMGKAVQIGKAASELGTNPRAPTNLALNAAPSSIRGPLENKLATSESGMLINKEGQNEYQRTKDDIFWRKFGLTSLEESKNRDGVYQSTAKRLADEKRRSEISHEVNMKFNQIGEHYLKSPGFEKLREEYIKRGGDPVTLYKNAEKYKEESYKTGKQRAEGEANGFSGAQRYKYYNP